MNKEDATDTYKINEISANAIVSEAESVAKNLIDTAARTASRMTEVNSEEKMTRTLANALREVFGENQASGRFIDISRIPLICQSINGIHESMKEMKQMMRETDNNHVTQEQFRPIKTIVYSGVGTILLAALAAVLSLIFINH